MLLEISHFEEEGPVTIFNWARTRAQKIIRDISFESDQYNIYSPHFSSEEMNSFDQLGSEHYSKIVRGIRPSNIDYLDNLDSFDPKRITK